MVSLGCLRGHSDLVVSGIASYGGIVKTKRIIIDIPVDEFEKLKIITQKQEYWSHPTEMATAVVRQYIKNMEEKLYPIIKEVSSQPTNTDVVKTVTK